MGLFDLFRRGRGKAPRDATGPKQSRLEYLLQLMHDQLEKPHKAYGRVNFLQLVEKQLEEGEVDRAIWNIASQVKDCFEIANLYWGQGDLITAETYLRKTLERHQRLVDACAKLDLPRPSYTEIEYAKCAAVLLGVEVEDFARTERFEPCYEPWFKDALLSYCLDSRAFDGGAWQNSENEWRKKRHPKYRMAEFSVYVRALTGQYASTDDMLAAHQAMFSGRARRNPDAGLLEGYHDNELIIDYAFAAILKRIGWEGTYRHSWPNTDHGAGAWTTTRQPDRYLTLIAAREPEPDSETGIIEDPDDARRFIDRYVRIQRDEEGDEVDARRSSSERSKVAAALKILGWGPDRATIDLMQSYRMDLILNDRTHLYLCDPLGGKSISMGDWTKLLSDEFGLHPDFIGIAASEEKSDYRDPQGAWYVYSKKDMRVYAVDRDDWHSLEAATGGARAGLNLWPSYTSFVAWWVSQHLESVS